jgi:septal ring factor EnvC (AmiA/AmiB activator)
MSSNFKLYFGIGVVGLVLLAVVFLTYHVYNYGYEKGYSASETYYLSQLEKLKQSQAEEQKRVSALEQQLFEASQKYEQLSSSFTKVQQENEKWKAQTGDAQKEALVPATVDRINEILDSYSSPR